MRIVSKRKEYYDAGMQYGVDNSITFVRNMISISNYSNDDKNKTRSQFSDRLKLPYLNKVVNDFDLKSHTNYSPFFIWFCGQLFLGYKITNYKLCRYPSGVEYLSEKKNYVYGEDLIDKIFILERKKHGENKTEFALKVREIEKNIKINNAFDISKDYNTPYFYTSIPDYYNEGHIKETPNLTELEFFKVKNVVQAFQEIESFIPSLKEEPISIMTDKQKIDSHGMDKTSFRCQAPGNKKENRVRNKLKKRYKSNV